MKKRIIALLLCICLVGSMTVYAVDNDLDLTPTEISAEDIDNKEPVSRGNSGVILKKVEDTNQINISDFEAFSEAETLHAPSIQDALYVDISAGDVKITTNHVYGYRYDGTSTPQYKTETIGSRYIYIYQSGGDINTGFVNGKLVLPNHTPVTYGGKSWGEYITNNTDVEAVISAWNSAASARKASPYCIYTSTATNEKCYGTYKIILDNVWSSYQTQGAGAAQNRHTGGLAIIPEDSGSYHGIFEVHLIGDNRFGNIHYNSQPKYNTNGELVSGNLEDPVNFEHKLTFMDYAEDSSTGTLTVANLRSNADDNYLSSAIGGSDGHDTSTGIIINSGIIYAGTNHRDNSTAIGGGGNGYGQVTINGGTITAVSSSSGTAIGGGIGTSGYGGSGQVKITGGTVYAYNFGPYNFDGANYWSEEDYNAGRTYPSYNAYPVAIGGGSSTRTYGSEIANVNISGGTVYAQSTGGAAIGGGGSATTTGGNTEVNISGGNVTAKSIAGYWKDADEEIPVGVGIGGGTGRTLGGDAVVRISGDAVVKTGSIGGGKAFNANAPIGCAEVYISGGTTQGQVIMAKGATKDCVFQMTGGTIDNITKTDDFVFLKENGGAVYVENGNATMSGGTIKNCDDAVNGGVFYVTGGNVYVSGTSAIQNNTAQNGGVAYINTGNFVMSGGKIGGSTDTANTALKDGGAIYVTGGSVTMTGGSIANNSAQNGGAIYITNGNLEMISGSIINNTAEGNASSSGGAAYVNGGSIIIGVEKCTGEGTNHTEAHTDKSHPVVSGNTAQDCGGGLAVMGNGTITMHCGDISANEAPNKGRGENVYMQGGKFTHNGGEVGETGDPDDPDLVIVGGTLDDNTGGETGSISVTYVHCNDTSTFKEEHNDDLSDKTASVTKSSYFNLPDGEKYWDAPAGYNFFGWTESSSNNGYVRNKNQYKGLGLPYVKSEPTTLYALWAPTNNTISCIGSLIDDEYSSETLSGTPATYPYTYDVSAQYIEIKSPTKAGYDFVGWYVYQNEGQNANWGDEYEPVYTDSSKSELNFTEMKKDQFVAAGANGTTNLYIDGTNFGDITLVAEFKSAYTSLTIEKKFPDNADYSIDENQVFVFNIHGDPADGSAEFDITVSIVGTGSIVIDNLPVGEYTVTELTKWSWRYNPDSNYKEINLIDSSVTNYKVSFTNTRDPNKDKWLTGDSYCENSWKPSTTTTR